MNKLGNILSKLSNVKKVHDGYMSLCPAHKDVNPSLHISDGGNGKILIHCFAGCSFENIVNALGLDKSIFAPDNEISKTRIICNIHDYVDENGNIQYQVVRFSPKDFRMRKSNGNGGWIWEGPSNNVVVPFNLPAVLDAISKGETVFIVEGEKDCESLISIGLVATCNHGGAGKWQDVHSKRLKNANVAIIPDKDEPGKRHAEKVSKSLVGIANSIRIIDLPDLPPKGKDISDWLACGHTRDELMQVLQATPAFCDCSTEQGSLVEENPWQTARKSFPRIGMPWSVFPTTISDSLRLLARSCASDPEPLVGAALAIIASVIGGTSNVLIKDGWMQPLIMWVADIRPSGKGKTPGVERLMMPLRSAQNIAEKQYGLDVAAWKALPSDQRPEEPQQPRGYFITDLTVEGLRDDISGHGGVLVYHSELSSLISTQDRYRSQGGGDREAWLTIWDGHSSRIVRAGRIIYVPIMRVSVCGGVQSDIWQRVFGGKDGLYISDGTVYRLLVTYYDGPSKELDDTTWDDCHQNHWNEIVFHAMSCADRLCQVPDWSPHSFMFSRDAYSRFRDWRNNLMALELDMPVQFRGYLPKAVSYAARLSGILLVLHEISRGKNIDSRVLEIEDVNRGIDLVMYYLGQAVDAMMSLTGRAVEAIPYDATPQLIGLCNVLQRLCPNSPQGKLPISDIATELDKVMPSEQKLSPRGLGTYLRSLGLDTTGRIRVGDRAGICALEYNDKVINLLKNVNNILISTNPVRDSEDSVDENSTTPPTSTSCLSVDVVDVCTNPSTSLEQPVKRFRGHVDVVDDGGFLSAIDMPGEP